MSKRLLLFLFLLSLCLLGFSQLRRGHASPYTNIDVDTAYNMIEGGLYPDLVVLDVRNQGEYDSGHIYGAVWIPVSELEARISELAGHEDHEIIVYCRSGGRSVTASGILDAHNFIKVYNMLGGITAWQSGGYPVWIATVHNINTTFNYDTIQASIDAPQTLDGHTIAVDPRTYNEHIVVKKTLTLIGENKDTTIIDGGGIGNVILATMNNTAIIGFTIRRSGFLDHCGIRLQDSNNSSITGNIITDNGYGIQIQNSNSCTISGNTIASNARDGIELYFSHRNIVASNDIRGNLQGISFSHSPENVFYHNGIVGNTIQTTCWCSNTWDDDYPSGGNYWSDYADVDLFRGLYQNVTGSDGIGDKPYDIDAYNRDRYPLMKPYGGPHDIGITNVTMSQTVVEGYNLNMSIKAVNYGISTENFNVIVYANEIIIQTTTITLTSRNSTTITLTWNTTGFPIGKYTITAEAPPVPSEIDTTDNILIDGFVKIIFLKHEIEITDVIPHKTVAGKGHNAPINVAIENWGNYTETFNVTAYYGPGNATGILIETQNVTLTNGGSTTVSFTWNTTGIAKGNYTISANATSVPGETNITDNSLTDGWIIVAMIGDITGPPETGGWPDGKCNIRDIALVASKFGVEYPDPRFDPNCDLTGPTIGVPDGKINIRDIALVATHFGETDP